MRRSILKIGKSSSIVGWFLRAYKNIYLILAGIISALELAFAIRGILKFAFTSFRHYIYMFSYVFLFIFSIANVIFLLISKKHHFSDRVYSIVLRIYVFAIFLWSICVAYTDILSDSGSDIIVFLTVIASIAGLVVIEPFVYIPMLFGGSILLYFLDSINGHQYFVSGGKIINLLVFLSMACIINIRHYLVSAREYEENAILEESVLKERARVTNLSLETIKSICNAVDAKDKYTRAHSQRVAEYSSIIAKQLNWSEDKIKEIHEIALLHDIGKIGVPDSILNCAGRLSNEEYEIMKKHTIYGADILKDLTVLENVDLGAKYHHERYDGNGYPSKLKGEEIPLIARIIAVADAFDAMNSNRVYRKRMTKETIIEELIKGRGTQFDPAIIDAFMPCAIKILEEQVLEDE